MYKLQTVERVRVRVRASFLWVYLSCFDSCARQLVLVPFHLSQLKAELLSTLMLLIICSRILTK